jgi:hypothetical protein
MSAMRRVRRFILSLVTMMWLSLAVAVPVMAAPPTPAPDPLAGVTGVVCVKVPITGKETQGRCPAGQVEVPNDKNQGGAIIQYLKWILIVLNGLVGGIILLAFIVSGIQYIVSSGDPSQVKAAKHKIVNAVIALVLYLLMFAILNFLVPGGIL